MKVLLTKDVENLGYAGEVYKVADGYGRNYLIPRGLAEKATPKALKQAEAWRKQAEARRAELRAEYEALATRIEQLTLEFTARAGETGKLYGSVTTAEITDALNAALGTEIDRRKVGGEPLRQLGEHEIVVRLSADIQPNVTVLIMSEDGAFEAEAAAIAEAEAAAAAEAEATEAEETEEVEEESEETAEAAA